MVHIAHVRVQQGHDMWTQCEMVSITTMKLCLVCFSKTGSEKEVMCDNIDWIYATCV